MGLRARKCKPSLGKVTKKPGLLKGTGEKTMSPSSKFLAITICHLNNAFEYKPPSFKPLPPLKYLRFDPESLPSLVCSMGCAWDLRISALQCSNIPAFSLRAQVGRGIVAAPWLSTFVMSECACNWPQPSMSTGTRTTTFGWQPVCSAPGKWSNSSSVPENVIASPSVSKALLPALHIHLSSVQTKKVRG